MKRMLHRFGEILNLLYSFPDDVNLFHFPFVPLDLIAWISTEVFLLIGCQDAFYNNYIQRCITIRETVYFTMDRICV